MDLQFSLVEESQPGERHDTRQTISECMELSLNAGIESPVGQEVDVLDTVLSSDRYIHPSWSQLHHLVSREKT